MSRRVVHVALLSLQSAATPNGATTNTVRKTIEALGSLPLGDFDELIFNARVSTAQIGSTPTLDVFLQRALRPDADPTDDTHWDDFANILTVTTATLDDVMAMPVESQVLATPDAIAAGRARSSLALAARTVRGGHWGDRLRLVEHVTSAGAITTAGIYSIDVTGIRH